MPLNAYYIVIFEHFVISCVCSIGKGNISWFFLFAEVGFFRWVLFTFCSILFLFSEARRLCVCMVGELAFCKQMWTSATVNQPHLEENQKKEGNSIIIVSKAEKEAIVARYPSTHFVRTMKGDSKRHHYYMEETDKAMKFLEQMRGDRIGKEK